MLSQTLLKFGNNSVLIKNPSRFFTVTTQTTVFRYRHEGVAQPAPPQFFLGQKRCFQKLFLVLGGPTPPPAPEKHFLSMSAFNHIPDMGTISLVSQLCLGCTANVETCFLLQYKIVCEKKSGEEVLGNFPKLVEATGLNLSKKVAQLYDLFVSYFLVTPPYSTCCLVSREVMFYLN